MCISNSDVQQLDLLKDINSDRESEHLMLDINEIIALFCASDCL